MNIEDYEKTKSTYESLKIMKIDCDKDNFYLIQEKENNNISYSIDYNPYISINNNLFINEKNYGYELSEGDIFKVGRFKIKIRKIFFLNINENNILIKSNNNLNIENKEDQIENECDNINNENNKIEQKNIFINNKEKNDNENNIKNITNNKICKICYSSSNVSPLISPCNCTGSLKYIHLSCLHQWLKSKVKIYYKITGNVIIHAFRLEPVQCEICKEYFPDYCKINNKLYEICDYSDYSTEIEKLDKSVISLETIGSEKHHDKIVYQIYFKNENKNICLKLGRSSECDIKLNDATISREHSCMNIYNNKLFIGDLNSKYGTAVLIQNNAFKLIDKFPIIVQIGRSIIRFFQKDNGFFSILCCIRNQDTSETYENENKKGINFEEGYIIKYNSKDQE